MVKGFLIYWPAPSFKAGRCNSPLFFNVIYYQNYFIVPHIVIQLEIVNLLFWLVQGSGKGKFKAFF
jgi:hypothetical protein